MNIKSGRYSHFKGNDYEVVGVARDSETMEEVVVYRALYGERGLWVRSAQMFAETIERDGRTMPRFQYIGPAVED
jgi:cyclomaltodextrinase / maltogenic alpha-amylase / neopullulanase